MARGEGMPKSRQMKTIPGTVPATVPPPRTPSLTVIAGPGVGRKITLTDGAVLGRSESAEIQFDHQGISRTHARLKVFGLS